jgi:hypothetical protein
MECSSASTNGNRNQSTIPINVGANNVTASTISDLSSGAKIKI